MKIARRFNGGRDRQISQESPFRACPESPKGTHESSPNTVHLRKCSMFGVELISPGRGGEKLAQRVRSCEAIKIHEYLFWRE
jgi:hypothetical protein